MKRIIDRPFDRPNPSRVLAEARRQSRITTDVMDPGSRMEAAFALSKDARMFLVAGLKAQGFPETEIRTLMGEKS